MPDTEPILTLLTALILPGEVLELRYIQRYRNTTRVTHPANGYFNDPPKLLAEALRYARRMHEYNQAYEAWVTLNPVRRDLLAATYNALRLPACWLTINPDVTRRAALVVQFQGKYPAAKERAYDCRDWLVAQDYPAPAIAYNGKYIDAILAVTLPNTPNSTAL